MAIDRICAYTYVEAIPRPQSITYPNSQSTTFGDTGGQRLQDISNLYPSASVMSKFDYTYDAVGNILTWQQQTDSNTPNAYNLLHDNADQLLDATLVNTSTSAVVHRYAYGYNAASNRTTQQTDNNVNTASYNAANQLTGSTGGGSMRFAGTLSTPSKVTVNGAPATVSGTNFVGSATVTTGTNTVVVSATDPSGNNTTHGYQVTVSGNAAQTLTYDANGNLLSDGTRTFQWDAANHLLGIQYPSTGNQLQFTYDGLGRRVMLVQSLSGTVTSTQQWVWDGATMAEERDGTDTVTKRFYGQGEQISGTSYYYTRDHLGSAQEMTDGSGTIQARYSYDPYGNQTKISGSLDSDFQYAGYYYLAAPSGIAASFALNLTLYRAYNPVAGRWLNRDPVGEQAGVNLYLYVSNSPIGTCDPLGLDPDLNLFAAGDPTGSRAANIPSSPNESRIVAHGSADGVLRPGANVNHYSMKDIIPPEELGKMIKQLPKTKDGKPARLMVCKVGQNKDYLTKVANAAGVPIRAPDKDILWSSDSNVVKSGYIPIGDSAKAYYDHGGLHVIVTNPGHYQLAAPTH